MTLSPYKVSLLVPVYNVERYIERCARSLFAQTYPNLEYVFVNDCTPDDSISILKMVLADYPNRAESVIIVNHEKNRGIAATRNTALDNVTGEFVSMVDSDDWLEKDAIEVLVKKQVETDADIVSGNIFEHKDDETGKIWVANHGSLDKIQRVSLAMSGKMGYSMWGRLIRKTLFEEKSVRCVEGYNVGEDMFMFIILTYFADKMNATEDFIYHYDKRNPDSLMHNNYKPKKIVNNFCQEFQNRVFILDFFRDKERDYYEKAVWMVGCRLKLMLKLAVKYEFKDVFYNMVEWIDSHEDCAKVIHWKKDGVVGWCAHNYYCMRIKWQKDCLIKKFKWKNIP